VAIVINFIICHIGLRVLVIIAGIAADHFGVGVVTAGYLVGLTIGAAAAAVIVRPSEQLGPQRPTSAWRRLRSTWQRPPTLLRQEPEHASVPRPYSSKCWWAMCRNGQPRIGAPRQRPPKLAGTRTSRCARHPGGMAPTATVIAPMTHLRSIHQQPKPAIRRWHDSTEPSCVPGQPGSDEVVAERSRL